MSAGFKAVAAEMPSGSNPPSVSFEFWVGGGVHFLQHNWASERNLTVLIAFPADVLQFSTGMDELAG